ncbi:MAG: MarR family winged helix-turn-helix transcriptional regulator [Candidatus Methanoplasma sp.]|jgi:DNA-binding MarR family transcriptional regulator|nr:MarR family winged helix-turn-helix transcriptional regulator [Candidatus Methanoplasma sp.]
MDYDDLTQQFINNMQAIKVEIHKVRIRDHVQGEAFVLYFIKNCAGRVIPSKISNAIGISSARVAAALNNLEGKGLITRRIDDDDRRRIIVELTPKGVDYVEEHQKEHIRKMRSLLVLLGKEDSAELVRIMGKLAEVLSKTGPCDRGPGAV